MLIGCLFLILLIVGCASLNNRKFNINVRGKYSNFHTQKIDKLINLAHYTTMNAVC